MSFSTNTTTLKKGCSFPLTTDEASYWLRRSQFSGDNNNMEDVMQAIEVARATGKIRKGVNEVTKAVERGNATMVAIASDVNPKELIMHLPVLCEEKGVTCVEDVGSREELGAAAGIAISTVCVAITKAGDAKEIIKDVKKANEPAAPAKEETKDEKPAKEDSKKEEKPAKESDDSKEKEE